MKTVVDVNKPVTNPELVESMNAFLKEPGQKSERKFFHLLVDAHFLAPVIIEPSLPESEKEDGTTVLKEGTTIQFITITNTEEVSFFPAFTDWEELNKWSNGKKTQTMILTFKDYETMLKDSNNIAGFSINPFNQNIILGNKQIQYVNQHVLKVEEDETVQIGIPEDYPTQLVEELRKFLSTLEPVRKAYLLLMIRKKQEQSFLIVVDAEGDTRELFPQIADTGTKYLRKGEVLDFVPYQSEFGKNAVKNHAPFYEKVKNKKSLFHFFRKK
ncbi:enhanced serine sensitivity protein SseB [Bacillaceae bacterium Marseille-Q3522]|nr:enhanced serine sensitivity protein SseB [Bacillaceae bacterium Marseille-Q3522]